MLLARFAVGVSVAVRVVELYATVAATRLLAASRSVKLVLVSVEGFMSSENVADGFARTLTPVAPSAGLLLVTVGVTAMVMTWLPVPTLPTLSYDAHFTVVVVLTLNAPEYVCAVALVVGSEPSVVYAMWSRPEPPSVALSVTETVPP